MRALVVYCHPSPESYTAAVVREVFAGLEAGGAETRILDLYERGFQPVLTRSEWETHTDAALNVAKVAEDVALLKWCDAILFVYPTWWYGPPAILKGWLEKAMVAGVAFHMPNDRDANIRPGLTHVRTLGIFTTCGATRWLSTLIGHPGKKTILRGLGVVCHPMVRKSYVALYDMNHADRGKLAKHLAHVRSRAQRLATRHRPGSTPASA